MMPSEPKGLSDNVELHNRTVVGAATIIQRLGNYVRYLKEQLAGSAAAEASLQAQLEGSTEALRQSRLEVARLSRQAAEKDQRIADLEHQAGAASGSWANSSR